jgi:hypothetical protein
VVDEERKESGSGGGIMKGFWDAVGGERGVWWAGVEGLEDWFGRTSPSAVVQPLKATVGSGDDWWIRLLPIFGWDW